MEAATIARPYAKAAFEYACEHNLVNEWLDFLANLALMVRDRELREFLLNPNVSKDKAATELSTLCQQFLPKGGDAFLHLMAERKRLLVLPEVSELFQNYVAAQLKTVDVKLVSAQTLTEQQQAKLSNALEAHFNKKIQLQTVVDEALIGGVIIHADDLVIDGSIRGRLKQLYKKLAI